MVGITKIVTANETSLTQVEILRTFIKNYFNLRKIEFPSLPIYPKHHYLFHIPDLILIHGPPNKYWTMFFEHKHQTFKYILNHIHDNVNLAKTLTQTHQYQQALLNCDRFKNEIICNTAFLIKEEFDLIQIPKSYTVASKELLIKNISFKNNQSILIKYDTSTLELLKIEYFVLSNSYDDYLYMEFVRNSIIMNSLFMILYPKPIQNVILNENEEVCIL